jgi:GH25 family lysozyme M1 (1,4-beta-N-acetylmuramidase)
VLINLSPALITSRRALAALALALAAAGGSVAVIRAVAPSHSLVSPPTKPSLAVTAAQAASSATPGGRQAAGSGGTGAAPLSRSAGQGDPGPLPADGAVPGASPAIQAQAAARAAVTALPHSPQLLAQLAVPVTSALRPSATLSAAESPWRLPGLDVAAFQHPASRAHPGGAAIHWGAVARAGYKFAAVKATEGDYYVNPWAASDLRSAKAAGLDVAPYHFAVPNVSGGAAQARFAVEYSGYTPGPRTLPLTLDIEYDPYRRIDHANECYGLSAARMTAWLAAFVAEARALTGQYPVINTTADWWDTCTRRSTEFGADPMWVAAYGFAGPPLPAGWKAWTFWQYTSAGRVPGLATRGTPGTADLDTFSSGMVGLISPGRQSATAGARVRLPVTSLSAEAGEALTYSAVGLPPGLAVGKDGTVRGTITAAAAAKATVTYRVTISVRSAAGGTETATFDWTVRPA